MTDLTAEEILAAIDRALERVSLRLAAKDKDAASEGSSAHHREGSPGGVAQEAPTKRKMR